MGNFTWRGRHDSLVGTVSSLLAGFLAGNHACWRLHVKLLKPLFRLLRSQTGKFFLETFSWSLIA